MDSGLAFVDRRGRQYRVRPGRRRTTDCASDILFVRVTREEHVAAREVATLNQQTLADFVRAAINAACDDCGVRRIF